MAGPAPKEIQGIPTVKERPGKIVQFVPRAGTEWMESSTPEQKTRDLHTEVSHQLNEAGHKVTPQSVNPEDKSSLNGIKEALGDTTHVVGSTFEELMGGTDDMTHVRTTGGETPIREFKRRLFSRFGKKAA